VLLTVAGCGSASTVEPAPNAGAGACKSLIGRVPRTVLGAPRNTLDVTGAASWGDPAVVLRCGVTPPGPTTDRCVEANGLDWVFSETKTTYQFVSYGRNPAIEVRVPASIDRTEAPNALIDLADAVRPIAVTTKCVGLDETG
jgi:hypothetical protein